MSQTTINVTVLGRNGLAKKIYTVGKSVQEACQEEGVDFATARVNGNPVSTSQCLTEGDIITSTPSKEVTGNA